MALTKGTNCGFVTVAPSADPGGTDNEFDAFARAFKDTSPANAVKITEVGWYCDNATEEANFEVGLYAADGAGGIPGTLLYSETVNAKGTTSGWKKKTGLNWTITPETAYYIAVQLDNTATGTNSNYASLAGQLCYRHQVVALPSPWTSITVSVILYAFYAVWEAAVGGTNMKINISDVLKDVDSLKINIGDAWKDVIAVKQNIGDVWKDVF